MRVASLLIAGGLALWPHLVSAHPVDEMVQGAYIMLAPAKIGLELDLTPGSEVVQTLVDAIDLNRDGVLDDAEGQAFGENVIAQSRLHVDEANLPLSIERISMPSSEALIAGSQTIQIFATATRDDGVGEQTLVYENAYAPVKTLRMSNIFLQPGNGWSYEVVGQTHGLDGATLTVDFRTTRK